MHDVDKIVAAILASGMVARAPCTYDQAVAAYSEMLAALDRSSGQAAEQVPNAPPRPTRTGEDVLKNRLKRE